MRKNKRKEYEGKVPSSASSESRIIKYNGLNQKEFMSVNRWIKNKEVRFIIIGQDELNIQKMIRRSPNKIEFKYKKIKVGETIKIKDGQVYKYLLK